MINMSPEQTFDRPPVIRGSWLVARSQIFFYFLLLTFSFLLMFVGCESEKAAGPATPTDAQGWINQGWAKYGANDLNSAYESFNQAYALAETDFWGAYSDSAASVTLDSLGNLVVLDSLKLAQATASMAQQVVYVKESLTGIGWTTIKDVNSGSGVLAFDGVLSVDPNYADALAGYAILLQTIDEYQQSNDRIATLFSSNSTWIFQHDTQIDYKDLLLLRAENYYYLANFEASLDEALVLNSIVNYQPGLDASDFNLATIEGKAQLIELIEALDDLI